MPTRRITIRVLGLPQDKGHVRLTEFIRQLESVKNALKHTERALTGSEDLLVYWRVVDLRHESPATVVLEEVAAKRDSRKSSAPPPVADEFIRTLREIARKAVLPDRQKDLSVLESYRELGALADSGIAGFNIRAGRRSIDIGERFRKNIDRIIGPDELIEGSISGVLEAINLHNTLRFNIYPEIGPKKVTCSFASELKGDVIRALDQYVTVAGTLRYKSWSPFPHAVDVKELEILPDEDTLPALAALRGIAEGATGDLSSEDFVRKLRDAEQ